MEKAWHFDCHMRGFESFYPNYKIIINNKEVDRVKMKTVFGLIKSGIELYTEWFWQYRVSVLLLSILVDIFILYGLFGSSLVTSILYIMYKVILSIHVIISLIAVLNDYVYNKAVVLFCSTMVYIIVIRTLIETLI